MPRRFSRLTRFVKSPWTNMMVGSILIFTSLWEIWGTFWEDLIHLRLRAHHGVIMYGMFTVIKSIPDLHEGVRHIGGVEVEE